MSEEVRAQRSWAQSERELAEAPLPELVARGPIVGGSPPRLCYLAAARNVTGRLILDVRPGLRHELFFRRGVPVGARSSAPELGLLDWLRTRGVIDEGVRAQARAAGGDPLAALFRLGALGPANAFEHLAAHGRAIFARALEAEEGSFAWEPDVAAPDGGFPLGGKWALLCEYGRRLAMDVVARRLGARIDCPVMRAGDGLVPIGELGLNALEMRAVAGFDGTRSLAMLAAASPAEAETIYRTGLFLAELGLASFAKAILPRPAGAPLPSSAVSRDATGGAQPARPSASGAASPSTSAVAGSPGAAAHAAPSPARIGSPGSPGGRGAAASSTAHAPAGRPSPGLGHSAGPGRSAADAPGLRTTARGAPAPGFAHSAGPGRRATDTPGLRTTARGAPAPGLGHSAGPGRRATDTPGLRTTARGAPAPGLGHSAGPGRSHADAPGLRTTARGAPAPGFAHSAGPGRFPTDAPGLRRLLEELSGKNHFEVLGLARSATPEEIKHAYFLRARAFHPDLSGTGDDEVRRLREAITARLNEAWHCLSDEARRKEYLAELQSGAASRVDVANVLAAEQLFQQAMVLAKLRRWEEVLAELDRAIALHPDEGEFYAWRGWARFSLASEKTGARAAAMADIDKAIARNPRCAPAWLFAARIANLVGDASGAIQYYRRCLAVDEANVEAQRELRLLESRLAK